MPLEGAEILVDTTDQPENDEAACQRSYEEKEEEEQCYQTYFSVN